MLQIVTLEAFFHLLLSFMFLMSLNLAGDTINLEIVKFLKQNNQTVSFLTWYTYWRGPYTFSNKRSWTQAYQTLLSHNRPSNAPLSYQHEMQLHFHSSSFSLGISQLCGKYVFTVLTLETWFSKISKSLHRICSNFVIIEAHCRNKLL